MWVRVVKDTKHELIYPKLILYLSPPTCSFLFPVSLFQWMEPLCTKFFKQKLESQLWCHCTSLTKSSNILVYNANLPLSINIFLSYNCYHILRLLGKAQPICPASSFPLLPFMLLPYLNHLKYETYFPCSCLLPDFSAFYLFMHEASTLSLCLETTKRL